ncbi:MAG: HXXEE domain-containing protein [Bacteroidia bacterium]|nr:HXXEE domain-containing protein [Bacteroidia bacterium]
MQIDLQKITPVLLAFIGIVGIWFGAPSILVKWIFICGILITLLFFYALIQPEQFPEPGKLLPLYLIALSVQFLHFLEEYHGKLYEKLPILFDFAPVDRDAFITFNMVAYSIFILGALAIYGKKKQFMLIPLFFILVGTVANAVFHCLLALWQGAYFPGLYTALIYLILGPMMLRILLRQKGLVVS